MAPAPLRLRAGQSGFPEATPPDQLEIPASKPRLTRRSPVLPPSAPAAPKRPRTRTMRAPRPKEDDANGRLSLEANAPSPGQGWGGCGGDCLLAQAHLTNVKPLFDRDGVGRGRGWFGSGLLRLPTDQRPPRGPRGPGRHAAGPPFEASADSENGDAADERSRDLSGLRRQ